MTIFSLFFTIHTSAERSVATTDGVRGGRKATRVGNFDPKKEDIIAEDIVADPKKELRAEEKPFLRA